jgi:hypothetical protein
MDLMRSHFGDRHHVTMDNWFTSPKLMHDLRNSLPREQLSIHGRECQTALNMSDFQKVGDHDSICIFMQQNMSTFEYSSAGWHDIEVQA